jgi:hypothetical protein
MAALDNLAEAARRPVVELAPEVAGSLVLLDAGAAEVAQLSLGPAFLFGGRGGGRWWVHFLGSGRM